MRTVRLMLATAALAAVAVPFAASAQSGPDPFCRLYGKPSVEIRDGAPYVVVERPYFVC